MRISVMLKLHIEKVMNNRGELPVFTVLRIYAKGPKGATANTQGHYGIF